MKSPKKSSKEPSLPSPDESRRTNVLMEQMLSKFDTFGEAQAAMGERLDRMEPDLHAVKEDVAVLKAAARSHTAAILANTDEIRSLKGVVQGHTEAIQSMQADLKTINQRVEVVEAKLT